MTETSHLRVAVQREIEAAPETVWTILTTPALFSEWMDGNVTFEAAPGSPFRADFPRFQTVIVGEVRAVDPADRVFEVSWGVESGPQAGTFPVGSSIVSFRVQEADPGCRVEIVHSSLPSSDEAKAHDQGWRFHLSRMALLANRSDLASRLTETLAAWYKAWNETDDRARAELLRACCADEVVFRDEWTALTGRDLLAMHIGNCQQFIPGYRLDATDDVRICRGEVLAGWRAEMPGGTESGHNHLRVDRHGRILRATGFSAGGAVPS